ncbi:MAG: protein kinase [Coprobacillus cateniformis]|nr:protein kinase [Coprobacillus cateniformis]
MNVNYLLERKYYENKLDEASPLTSLYDNIDNIFLKELFIVMHMNFNDLFNFMYYKKKINNHYNADQSRKLIYYIKLYDDLYEGLKNTNLSFEINEDYKNLIVLCKEFLHESGGSIIPEYMPIIDIIEYDTIFTMNNIINVNSIEDIRKYPKKLIGRGSYALVYKYYDEFYNKKITIKRAKADLNKKEIERFKREFEVLNQLSSPYIIDVYRYNTKLNEYYMECADDTLFNYINKNNNKLTVLDRRRIVNQICRGFSYIHSKGFLHRDISLTNILIFKYDDTIVAKISDFGLVKEECSQLTSTDSEIKGSLNDSNLQIIGFSKYNICHETFALTRLIYFILTGKTNMSKEKDLKIKKFIDKGTHPDINQRFRSVEELTNAFYNIYKISN